MSYLYTFSINFMESTFQKKYFKFEFEFIFGTDFKDKEGKVY